MTRYKIILKNLLGYFEYWDGYQILDTQMLQNLTMYHGYCFVQCILNDLVIADDFHWSRQKKGGRFPMDYAGKILLG
jgi:hypothetical protein